MPTKTRKKKSNKYGSRNAYFLRSVHLSIVADDVWFESASVTDKVNIEETNTIWAQSLTMDKGHHVEHLL